MPHARPPLQRFVARISSEGEIIPPQRLFSEANDDRRIGITLTDLMLDIVPIVRSIAGKRRNRSHNLLK
jgi:hypothetical protein